MYRSTGSYNQAYGPNRSPAFYCLNERRGARRKKPVVVSSSSGEFDRRFKYDDGFFRHAFLKKPLPLVQTVLAAVQASATIRELSDIDNKVMDSHTQPLTVAPVISGTTTISKDDKFSLLLGGVCSLSRELQCLKLKVEHNHSRGRSRSSNISPSSRSPSRPCRRENTSCLCWYHQTFGKTPSDAAPPAPLRETGTPDTNCGFVAW